MLPESYEKFHRKAEYIPGKLKYLRINKPDDLEMFADDETLQMSILYGTTLITNDKPFYNKLIKFTGEYQFEIKLFRDLNIGDLNL